MNRADKRRQQKLAKKAAKKSARNPSAGTATQQQSPVNRQLAQALQHHNAGRLSQAEAIYKQILRTDPRQPDALHLLGVIAHQAGQDGHSVDLISKALAQKPEFAEAHNNLGTALQSLKRHDEAITSYRKAISISPNYATAHYNLATALHEMRKFDDAIACYLKALSINPNYAEAHGNIGIVLFEQGKPDEAITSYQKAIAIKPDYAQAHANLGKALKSKGQLEQAVACYQQALKVNPNYAEAHSILGNAFKELGRLDDAFASHQRAVQSNPDNEMLWAAMADCLETISFNEVDSEQLPNLLSSLLQVLDRPSVPPSILIGPVISALRHHPNFAQVMEQAAMADGPGEISFSDAAGQLAEIQLFLKILELSPLNDLAIERALTMLRRAQLMEVLDGETTEEKGMAFSAALALQCFNNEYVFGQTPDEAKAVERLDHLVSKLIDQGRDVPPAYIAALGCYRALIDFPWGKQLLDGKQPGTLKNILERQISEPTAERSMAAQIQQLTAVQNDVSQQVREQYEQNPYPRWIKLGLSEKGRSIGAVLQGPPLQLDLGAYVSPENPEILVAGCGTGHHALSTATRFANAQVLAVDLSLSSLSYASRKAAELNFTNITFAQADIMELGSLDQRFDLIECAGVLHHLGDPKAGWQVLVDLLQPGGIMKIALYSELARKDVVRARSMIDEAGYTTSAQDLRACRQDMIARAEGGDIELAELCKRRDFFSLSDFRDLVFHVQEHRFTVPQIEAALISLKLDFLGFEMRDPMAMTQFSAAYPGGDAKTSLPKWHQFEQDNPDTFQGMYQFWCRKSCGGTGGLN